MSIYDRDYMKERMREKISMISVSASKVLICANIVAFFLQAFGERIFGRAEFLNFFGLSIDSLASGKVWTLVSYAFMHGDIFHIFCNLLGLYFIGKYVERVVGNKRFYILYFSGAIFGGLLWLLLSYPNTSETLIGASASVMAVFATFCYLYPPMPITFLLFFVIPISMRPMTMLKIATCFEVLGLLYSLAGGNAVVAYSAHLGGILTGLAFAMLLIKGKLMFIDNLRMPKFPKGKKTSSGSRGGKATDYAFKVNISTNENSADEIDRILDKISKNGFSSLSESERETLRKARDELNK